jgi:hypothetical protein
MVIGVADDHFLRFGCHASISSQQSRLVRSWRGEEDLRHASLQDFRDEG